MTMTSYNKYQTREVTIQLPGQVPFISTRSVWFKRMAMSGNLTTKSAVVVRGHNAKQNGVSVSFGSISIGHLAFQSGIDDVTDFASKVAANATAHTLTEIACILSRSSLSEENKKAVLALISLSYLFAGTEKASQLLVRTPEDFIKVATSPVIEQYDSTNQTEGEP